MTNAQLLAALAVLEETAYQTRKAIQDFSDAHPEEFPGSPEITEALEGIIGVTGAIHRAEKVVRNQPDPLPDHPTYIDAAGFVVISPAQQAEAEAKRLARVERTERRKAIPGWSRSERMGRA